MSRKLPIIIALTFILAVAQAQARPTVKATMTQAIVKYDASGHVTLQQVDAAPLRPGTVLEYAIVAQNGGSDPALNLKPAAKIPAGTAYKAGSAISSVLGAKPEFSLDGKTWSALPMVRVLTPRGVVQQPAAVSTYQAIRWTGTTALPAKARATFTYEVVVK